MSDTSNAIEGLKLLSDWAKWLVATQTGALAILGLGFKDKTFTPSFTIKCLATATVVSIVVSIAAAALLLLTLPEIAQTLSPNQNIWLTKDSVVGFVLGLNTQQLAIAESLFFGFGVVFFAALVIAATWSK